MKNVLLDNILRGKTKILNLLFLVFIVSVTASIYYVFAADTSTFNQTINSGTLTVDIVDDTYVSVSAPSINMSTLSFGFTCQTSTGTFGTTTQQIYVKNPDAADGGWTVSLAGSSDTAVWDSAGTDFDFNDPNSSGCVDGAGDPDSLGGQMTVDASGGSISVGSCSTCTTTGVSAGSSNSFSETVTDDITILSGAAGSDDIGDWTLQGVSISQKVPAEQPAASDYAINMVLSILAN